MSAPGTPCTECGGSGTVLTGECRDAMSGPTCLRPDCPPCQTPETETCDRCHGTGVDPSPPDHNPEQVVERLRKMATDCERTRASGEFIGTLRQAANLLDYYASVVEGLTSDEVRRTARIAFEEEQRKHREEPGPMRVAIQAALQHAQSKAEPKEEK